MKKTLTIALALTLLAGVCPAFAQNNYGNDNRDRNQPPVAAQQRGDDHNRNTPPSTQSRPDDHAMSDRGRNGAMAMRGPMHPDWRKGGRIGRDDWGRGVHVDYRAHHLRQPPRGYEWREVDGNYVLAAAATGLIVSIILANH
jgi:Ni/Co efflux regulator RcnB